MLNSLLKKVPAIGQVYSFIKTAIKGYNSTLPIEVVAVLIIDDFAAPQVKYFVKCVIILLQVGFTVSSGKNTWTVTVVVQLDKLCFNSKMK